MGKWIEDLRKAVAIGEKYGMQEDLVSLLLTLEAIVTLLGGSLITKHGEEKFFAFFKEVSEITSAPLSDVEVGVYRRRFRKVKEAMERVKKEVRT